MRYLQARDVTALLMLKGLHIFSPIVHCHELAKVHNLPKDFSFWQKYDKAMLSSAIGLWVLQLEGWEKSKGVLWEMAYANQLKLPIKLLSFPLVESEI